MHITEVLAYLVSKGHGRTDAELAYAIFGQDGYEMQVTQTCTLLEHKGIVERRGSGSPEDPYRYYPKGHGLTPP